jgi:hypothetical protein
MGRYEMLEKQVVVVGASGAGAQAMFEAADRARAIDGWVAVDRTWPAEQQATCEDYGIATVELDFLAEPGRLRELVAGAALVVNLAGPFYRTGAAVLDACIETGCDYLDICDDADATRALLDRDEAARAAGVRAVIGMGASPGLTNVLVRTASDWLGGADDVSLSWVVDVADLNDALLQHFWHSFAPVGPAGEHEPVPAWEQLGLRTATFPEPLGERIVIDLTHPEPITLTRFLGIEAVRAYGSVVPEDALVVNWALARLGASGGDERQISIAGAKVDIPPAAAALYESYLQTRAASDYLGGGLVVDVWSGEVGVRFAAGAKTSIDEATGIPAAAGIVLMLEGGPSEAGVVAPECLEPAEFFAALGKTGRGNGSLGAYRLEGSTQGERIRIRDMLKVRSL